MERALSRRPGTPLPGPALGDYTGLPINDAARLKADSWDASIPRSHFGITPVQGNVFMLVGADANITVQIGDEGVLIVDTGQVEPRTSSRGDSTAQDKPVRIVINTHGHPDHSGANDTIAKTGRGLGGNAPGNSGLPQVGARVVAHERVLARMSAPTGHPSTVPFGGWPTETFFSDDKEIFFNNEAIQLLHQPAAHTDGDIVVFFRRRMSCALAMCSRRRATLSSTAAAVAPSRGIVDALNRTIDITIPKDKEEGSTYVILGHGRLCDEADVVECRDMVTIVRDRIRDLIRKGMTLAEVKAARPTFDYDGRYGSSQGRGHRHVRRSRLS